MLQNEMCNFCRSASTFGARVTQSVWELNCGLENLGSIASKYSERIFCLCHCVKTSSRGHRASYAMDTRV